MKPLILLLTALTCAVSPVGAAPQIDSASESKVIKAFKRSFSRKKPESVERRTSALAQLVRFESQNVAKALADAHAAVDGELLSLENERVALLADYANLRRGREYAKNLPKPIFDAINALKPKLQSTRARVDDLRELWSGLRAQIGAIDDPDAVRWLVKNVLGSKRHSLLLKLEVSKLAGSLSEHVLDDLQRVFAKAKSAPQLVALLKGFTFAGKSAARIAPQVLKHLSHEDFAVREHAAFALAKMEVPEAIEPLINLLESEEGRDQEHIASALQVLTRQEHGVLVDAWRRWFDDEKDKLLAGEAPLGGGGMFERRKTEIDKGYYFDIAMEGKSIMYIIDASGSMQEEIQLKLKGADGKPQTQSRLEACKAELIRALGLLEKDAEFNIIWYNDIPYLFSEQMVKASKVDVKRGQDWVGALKPISFTNIYDSLKMTFDLAGQGARDKYYSVGLDTIFLLTDGSPTKPDGSADSTEKILEGVREWNVLKRITIHAIGVGRGINEGFLRSLASENNGEFRRY